MLNRINKSTLYYTECVNLVHFDLYMYFQIRQQIMTIHFFYLFQTIKVNSNLNINLQYMVQSVE